MASDGAEESQPIPENLFDETVNILEQTVHARGPALNLECHSSMAPGSIPATSARDRPVSVSPQAIRRTGTSMAIAAIAVLVNVLLVVK